VAPWNRPKSLWSLALAGLLASAAPAPLEAQQAKPAASKPADKPADKKAAAKSAAKPAAKPAAKSDKKAAAPAKTEKKTEKKTDKKAAAKKNAKTETPKTAAKPATAKPSAKGAVPAAAAPAAASTPPAAEPPRPAKPAAAPPAGFTAADLGYVKRALEAVRARRRSDANEVRMFIGDPVARKLVEWAILRSDDGADFPRYSAFIAANPGWPSMVTLRRKAEATLFQDRVDAASVVKYFGSARPLSAKGKIALARALLAQNDRKGAEALIRETWRSDPFSQEVELRVLDQFGDMLTRADHKARMDRRLYEKEDTDAGLRAATRLGGNEPAIAKARAAMISPRGDKKTVDAVPAAARDDVGYKLAKIQMLRRSDQTDEAAALMGTVPKLDDSHDLDEWWVERRLLVRKLLDEGEPKKAYVVARDATPPSRDIYRVEQEWTAGWVALRYLNDPTAAAAHFKKVTEHAESPISMARGLYWQGRAAEALKRTGEARQHYQQAARFPTAYYGQIARSKAGLGEIALNAPPPLTADQRAKLARHDVYRAAQLLYAVEQRDLLNALMADMGDKSDDIGLLTMLSELAASYEDPRAMLLVGKLALSRGHPLDHPAFPTVGLPPYKPIGPEVEPALVYSIARQESWFNPKTVSSANAMGFMQVTPAAGKYLAKKFKVPYDQKRLLSDMVYNMQMGAAELGDLIKDYRGSYIMSFAAYNAGRGRVREWVSRYGDPRDPKVDPIDWVERIPFAETRNYVQRVMENAQVYRLRFGGGARLLIEADLRRGSSTN
jgi:soluble lytic murein transglycosylase